VIAFSAGFASLILVTLSQNLNQTIGVVGFGITLALAAVASFLALKPKPPKLVFYLLLIASLVNVVLLMLGS
jgi:hypothetical protein